MLPRAALNLFPPRKASSTTSAIAATIHGSEPATPPDGVGRRPATEGCAPAAIPHLWQNFAPGVSGVWQPVQIAPSSDDPQLAQKRPVPAVAHVGQTASGDIGDVMGYNLNRAPRRRRGGIVLVRAAANVRVANAFHRRGRRDRRDEIFANYALRSPEYVYRLPINQRIASQLLRLAYELLDTAERWQVA